MVVGVLTLELMVFESRSLKDKRRVIKGLKAQISNRFDVSVAEVDHQDSHKRCTLGIAMVSSESRAIHERFDKLVDMVRTAGGASLIDYTRAFY